METGDPATLLHAVRRLRRATLEVSRAPDVLSPFLGHGLGPVCAGLASWVESAVTDRRAADITIRFFGLDRLPESLSQIGPTLRVSRPSPSHPVSGPVGLGSRRTQKLIGAAIADLAADAGGPPLERAEKTGGPWTDPFPEQGRGGASQLMHQVVLWAWAQVPDGDSTAAAALMLYEHEHGLRERIASPPSTRTERMRWRRLAWSMMQVASYRFGRAHTGSDAGSADQMLGPRRHALPGADELPGSDRAGFDALMSLSLDPLRRIDHETVTAAVELVQEAVRTGRAEAPELLGLLRDGLSLHRHRHGPAAVPPEAEAKVWSRGMILAREHRDVSGVQAGETARRRFHHLLELPSVRRSTQTYAAVLGSHLRTLQELAELYDSLGLPTMARRTLDHLCGELDRFGDPEQEVQPGGWLQQLLLTSALVNRHLATVGRNDPDSWHQSALAAADSSLDLARRRPGEMPLAWAVAAGTQRLAATLDDLHRERGRNPSRTDRLLSDAQERLTGLDEDSGRITDLSARSTRSARLDVRLAAWQLALLTRDVGDITRAQAQAVQAIGDWALPQDLDRIERYQRVGERLGSAADTTKIRRIRSRARDRKAIFGAEQLPYPTPDGP